MDNVEVKLRISFGIYLRETREKMPSRFASVTSEEVIQLNHEAVPETQRKRLNLVWSSLKVMVYVFNPDFIDKSQSIRFCLQMQINLAKKRKLNDIFYRMVSNAKRFCNSI